MNAWPPSVPALFILVLGEPAQTEKALKKHFRKEAPTTNGYRRDLADTLLGTLCFKRRLKELLPSTLLDDNTLLDDDAISLACGYWWNVRAQDPPTGLLSLLAPSLHATIKSAAQKELAKDTIAELAVAYSHPDWMVSSWSTRLSAKELELLLQVQNEKAPVWVRSFSRPEVKPEKMVAAFLDEDVLASPHDELPSALKISPTSEALNIWGSPLWQSGAFEVQDLGSQIVVEALRDLEGRVVDVCAGAGGKTLALAADENKVVCASDTNKHALVNLRARLRRHSGESSRRAAVNLVELTESSVEIREGPPDIWQGEEPFSGVLVDAPCSSTGTLRRGPARRWCIDSQEPEKMAELQQQILHQAASLVQDGGVLVYATCSLQKTENEGVVQSFLQSHENFLLESFPFTEDLFSFLHHRVGLEKEDGFFTLWPHQSGTDGFFMARFRHQSQL